MRDLTNEELKIYVGDDKSEWFIAVEALFLALGVTALILRFVSRRKINAKLGLDDYLICGATVSVS